MKGHRKRIYSISASLSLASLTACAISPGDQIPPTELERLSEIYIETFKRENDGKEETYTLQEEQKRAFDRFLRRPWYLNNQ